MKKLFLILVIVVLAAFAGGMLWINTQMQPIDPGSSQVVHLTVDQGSSMDKIGSDLVANKLVRSVWIFKLQATWSKLSKKIQAGDFDLTPKMSVPEIVVALTKGRSDKKVTLLEGWRREQIAEAISKELGVSSSEFLKLTQGMEGRLFPDTYSFPKSITAKQVVDSLAGEFQSHVENLTNKSGLTDTQALVLASLVERESRVDSERPVIAGILINRLNAKWPLQVDATVQYAKATVKCKALGCDWWKNDLTRADLDLNSPYNTYNQPGLPPAPICNPSLSSIKAVYNPTQTQYWFYLHDTAGQVHFAKTIEEHNANVAKFLGK